MQLSSTQAVLLWKLLGLFSVTWGAVPIATTFNGNSLNASELDSDLTVVPSDFRITPKFTASIGSQRLYLSFIFNMAWIMETYRDRSSGSTTVIEEWIRPSNRIQGFQIDEFSVNNWPPGPRLELHHIFWGISKLVDDTLPHRTYRKFLASMYWDGERFAGLRLGPQAAATAEEITMTGGADISNFSSVSVSKRRSDMSTYSAANGDPTNGLSLGFYDYIVDYEFRHTQLDSDQVLGLISKLMATISTKSWTARQSSFTLVSSGAVLLVSNQRDPARRGSFQTPNKDWLGPLASIALKLLHERMMACVATLIVTSQGERTRWGRISILPAG